MMTQKEILERNGNFKNIDVSRYSFTNLSIELADFSRARASQSEFDRAQLIASDFSFIYAPMSSFVEGDLHSAYFWNAYLVRADFAGANLKDADFYGANLSFASFAYANLEGANFAEANLENADFAGANLKGADFYGARSDGAIFETAKFIEDTITGPFVPTVCPNKGSFIGYKKAFVPGNRGVHYVIVTLLIPDDAKRSSGLTRKCRSDRAIVLSIENVNGTKTEASVAYSCYDSQFKYPVGEAVSVQDFDEDCWNTCSSGIHFFIDKLEATKYEI